MSETAADILERIHRDAAALRSIGGGSLVITIEPVPAVKAPAPSRPAANGRTIRDPATCRERERLVVAALGDLGPSVARDVARRAGLSVPQTQGALKRLEGRPAPPVRRTGTFQGGGRGAGRPSPVWELTGTQLPADQDVADLPAPSSREQAHQTDLGQRAAKHAGKGDRDAVAAITLLREGDRTTGELAGLLGISVGRAGTVLNSLSKCGRAERRGMRGDKALWRLRPLPSEQEDVTIRNGNGACSRTQVVECLRHGAASLRELADELGVRPSDVSLIAGPLEHEGLATRIADGKYQLLEAVAR